MEKVTDNLTKRKIQALNTKKTIYETAIELMEKSGFDGITIEDISKKAGVSVGAFYHYFDSKYDILTEIFKRIDDHFESKVFEKLKDKSSVKNIEAFFRYYAKYNVDVGLDMLKLLYHSNNKLFLSKGRFLLIMLSDIISKGQKDGEITDKMTPDEVSDFLFTVARGTAYHWCISEGNFDLQKKMIMNIRKVIPVIKK
ncbi:MAG: TetR/AcrR family transcriptional regulator [Spirochaetes bacterium]|nr:TetR/AcrR family transcriptional regulator [Spirochaetota bacterium]